MDVDRRGLPKCYHDARDGSLALQTTIGPDKTVHRKLVRIQSSSSSIGMLKTGNAPPANTTKPISPRPKRSAPKSSMTDVYSCSECDKYFEQHADALAHFKLAHKQVQQFKCYICYKTLPDAAALASHRLQHKKDTPHSCTVCAKNFSTNKYLDLHMRQHRGENPFRCTVCKQSFSTGSNLRRHKARCEAGEQNVETSQVDGRPNSPTPEVSKWTCKDCEAVFDKFETFTVHIAGHTDKDRECELCHKIFSTVIFVKKHKLSEHGNAQQKFQCSKCPEYFSQQSALDLHMLEHCGVKSFECEECMEKFASRLQWKSHMVCSGHTGDMPLRCAICDSRFRLPASLRQHCMCAHSLSLEEPPKVIDVEDDNKQETSDPKIAVKQEPVSDNDDDETVVKTARRCRAGTSLLIGRTSTSSAGTSLLIDRKLTKKLSKIAKQKSKHRTKAKIFRCELCDKLIFNSSGQAKHMKQHRARDSATDGAKSHLCRTCGESFATADSLKLHTANGRCVVFHCPACPQNFGTPDQLQHHMTTIHTDVKDDSADGEEEEEEEQVDGCCSNSGENVGLLDVGDIKTEPCDDACDSESYEPKYSRVIQKSAVQCHRCQLWLSSATALQHHTCVILPDGTC